MLFPEVSLGVLPEDISIWTHVGLSKADIILWCRQASSHTEGVRGRASSRTEGVRGRASSHTEGVRGRASSHTEGCKRTGVIPHWGCKRTGVIPHRGCKRTGVIPHRGCKRTGGQKAEFPPPPSLPDYVSWSISLLLPSVPWFPAFQIWNGIYMTSSPVYTSSSYTTSLPRPPACRWQTVGFQNCVTQSL